MSYVFEKYFIKGVVLFKVYDVLMMKIGLESLPNIFGQLFYYWHEYVKFITYH